MVDKASLAVILQAARVTLVGWPARYPGRRAMGYFCNYVPEEMIHCAGLSPVRLRGNTAPLRQVDAHLQSFTCAMCRSTLDQLLTADWGQAVAGAVLAHTCDTMQAAADLWRMHSGDSLFVDTVMQPANLGSPAARPYLMAELARFRQKLAAWAGNALADNRLRASIALYDETRRLIAGLQDQRDYLSASSFYAVLDAAQSMPREEFNPLLADLVGGLYRTSRRKSGPRLFLTGAILDEPRVLELIDDLGAQVAGDDLCTGSRHFAGLVGDGEDPIAALADFYLRRPPCPAKLLPGHDTGQHLLEQAQKVQADGVVFIVAKFCEPHAFDYALSFPTLDGAGLPHLLLEMEQVPSLEALRTRLQAFCEML
ncbi:MAG TPA: 2-hydroxyacyl-CoA dehydratase family protein [Anaerolineae bacterium]|nr:2-hydroxyacyl-CoA dehydratase family protein [Anaerolineae bacterium]